MRSASVQKQSGRAIGYPTGAKNQIPVLFFVQRSFRMTLGTKMSVVPSASGVAVAPAKDPRISFNCFVIAGSRSWVTPRV